MILINLPRLAQSFAKNTSRILEDFLRMSRQEYLVSTVSGELFFETMVAGLSQGTGDVSGGGLGLKQ